MTSERVCTSGNDGHRANAATMQGLEKGNENGDERAFRQALEVDILVLAETADVELPLALVAQDDREIAETLALEILLVAQHAAPEHVLLDCVRPASQIEFTGETTRIEVSSRTAESPQMQLSEANESRIFVGVNIKVRLTRLRPRPEKWTLRTGERKLAGEGSPQPC